MNLINVFIVDLFLSLILIKVDMLDLCNVGILNKIVWSKYVEKNGNIVKEKFGFYDCKIWFIVNYVIGIY